MGARSLTVAVLVGLVGCTCAEPDSARAADWRGDKRFSAEERAAIERGESWLAAHAGRLPATFDWSYDVAGEAPAAHTIRRERGPYGSRGASGLCVGSTVYLDPVGLPDEGMRPEFLPGLAAHEMAHCELGFVDGYHAADPQSDGIMRVLYPMRWTSAEDAQLAERRPGHVNTAWVPE